MNYFFREIVFGGLPKFYNICRQMGQTVLEIKLALQLIEVVFMTQQEKDSLGL